jgi:hypothetical protein
MPASIFRKEIPEQFASNLLLKKVLENPAMKISPIFYMTFLFQIPQIFPLLRSHQRDAAHLSTVLSLAQKISINMDLPRAMLFLLVS